MPGDPTTNLCHSLQDGTEATYVPYGDHHVVETFGAYEAEYAVIRKGVGIMDMPPRGLIEMRGADRTAFLQAMVTNDVASLDSRLARRALYLDKAGRIQADLVICQFDEQVTHVIVDAHDAQRLVEGFNQYIFTEDVELENQSNRYRQISLHGPAAHELLGTVCTEPLVNLDPWCCTSILIEGYRCRVFRRDETGSPGLHIICPLAHVAAIYKNLSGAVGGLVPDVETSAKRTIVGRGIGWLAYNTARIEAGASIYHIDYGPDTLPHEAALIEQTVSFTKGCYPGQEIVARMENLGHPKRLLVGLHLDDARLPIAGAQVFDSSNDDAQVVGAVTSSTVSPMRGGKAIGLAMVKWGLCQIGTELSVFADGKRMLAVVANLSMF